MRTAAARIQRLEKSLEDTGDGWELYEESPPPDLENGKGFWPTLYRIRRDHPSEVVRNMSLMEMAEDLIPGYAERVKRNSEDYEASHEFRWTNGRCYVRELPNLSR